MKSEWKVTSNVSDGGEKMYAVYRLLDTAEVDHSGNREFADGYMSYREAAVIVAELLNEGEGKKR